MPRNHTPARRPETDRRRRRPNDAGTADTCECGAPLHGSPYCLDCATSDDAAIAESDGLDAGIRGAA